MIDSQTFLDVVRHSAAFDIPAIETIEAGVRYITGQFWTARQRQGHSIHEISYRGCFKAELPGFFIEHLTEPGDGVYDPFAGRGTTLIEAALRGRRPLGNDINPLSRMLAEPRLRVPEMAAVQARMLRMRSEVLGLPPPGLPEQDLLAFFHPDVLLDLQRMRSIFDRRRRYGMLDHVDGWIRMVALNRLTGHSSGYFSGYTLPPNQAASAASQRRINAKRGQTPPPRDVEALILRKSRSLLRDGAPPPSDPLFSIAPASASLIPTAGASLVVTSPPFLDVIRYDQDNALRCWFAGIDVNAVAISMLKDAGAWQAMVRDVLTDLARVVRPGGHVAFEVGEVRGGKVLLERLVWEAAEGLPFERLAVIVNGGAFTKTARIWSVDNNAKGTNTNRIVLLRRGVT